MWWKIIINIFSFALSKYVENSKSVIDDKILDVAKESIDYLSKKSNNRVTKELADSLNKTDMVLIQKAW